MSKAKTLVVGLGEVGGALAEVIERTEPVLRHDIQAVDFDEPIGVMHLCFPFQSSEQYESAACGYIQRFRPSLTVINSTVLPGTTRAIAKASGAAVAYSPVRGKHARMIDDLKRYLKFVAAAEPDVARRAEEHFQGLGLKTRRMKRIETLELAKLAETTYFGVIIAFAQMLNRYCERIGGDYYEATEFFGEIDFLPGRRYFPGFIGGHCVIPNINLLLRVEPSSLLEAVLDSNHRRAAEMEAGAPATATGRVRLEGNDGKALGDR